MDVAPSDKAKSEPGLQGPDGGVLASISQFVRNQKPRKYFPDENIDKTIRERLFHARTLNRLNQVDAAELLGYKNSSALSKIESGEARVPKDFIIKAAVTYGVSCDYLMGLSDEPERDPKTAEHMAITRAVRNEILAHTQAMAEVLLANASDMTPMEAHVKRLLASANTMLEAFDKVCRRNKKFINDIAGGSTLQNAVDDNHAVALDVKRFMDRRANLVTARTQAFTKDRKYPLLEPLDNEERAIL